MAQLLDSLIKNVRLMMEGVRIEEIKSRLERTQGFIYDADRMGKTDDDKIKRRVQLLVEACYALDDLVDQYDFYDQHLRNPGCAALPCHAANLVKTMILSHQISHNIKDLESQVLAIKGSQFPVSWDEGASSFSEIRISAEPIFMDEAETVGLEGTKEKLLDWLINGREERTVISVVGMGGLGKTTLAKQVFTNMKVVQHFDFRVWITVSQSYTVDGLLRDMLQMFYREAREDPPLLVSAMSRHSLIDEVRKFLRQKRYVIFFDDVWNTYFWDQIAFAAFDNKNGSRVFVTTRSMDVAMSFCKYSPVQIHELQPLSWEHSWELFCRRAFQFTFNGHCPPHLRGILSDVVKKCDRNPLVIQAVAGLISVKGENESELLRLGQNLLSEFERNSMLSGITKIISLSYDDLPPFLKRCFLYFGMYPEDYEVESKRLIWQWMAEGFVQDSQGNSSEQVAEEYLTMMINRSLVYVSSYTIDGKPKGCGVHNLLHHMILQKCKDLTFCRYINEDTYQSVSTGKIHRLSVATSSIDLMGTESSHVRSLFFFTNKELPEQFVRNIPTKYRLMKVLDFEKALLRCVPEDLGKLFHLRYLSFRNTQVKYLPKSIGMLQNLETLDVRETHVHEMPKEISKLQKLQHLLASKMSLIQLRGCIRRMTSLETLNEVQIDYDEVELIEELGMLPQLRNLGLTNVRQEHEVETLHFQGDEGFKKLEELELTSLCSLSTIIVDIGALCCLRKLMLKNIPQLKTPPSGIDHSKTVLYTEDENLQK